MPKGKRMLLIDAKAREVREIYCEGPTLDFLQKQVGGYIELVRLGGGLDLWVNEEGLLHGEENFFVLAGGAQPYAGNGVIACSNDEGETTATSCPVADIAAVVRFTTRTELTAHYAGRR